MASFEGKSFDNGEFRGEINIEGVTEAGKQKDNTLLGDRVKFDQDKNSDSINNTDFSLILDSLKKMFDMSALIDAFQETGDVLSNFAEGSSLGELLERVGLGAKSKKNGENVNNRNKSAFKKLDPGNAAGFILIYNKLEDIYELLATGKGDKKKKKDSDGGLGKIGNFFKGLAGLGAALLTIGAAFLLFVGAIALAQKMQVDLVYGLKLAGMFVVFSTLFVFAAKLLKKDQEAIKTLAKSVIYLTVGLILFGVAVFIAAKLEEGGYVDRAKPLLIDFVVIMGLAVIAAVVAKKSLKNLIYLGLFSMMLSFSLILFGVALYVLSVVDPDGNAVWKVVGFLAILAVVVVITMAVGTAAETAAPFVVALGLFAVLFAFSLIVFAIGIWAVSQTFSIKAALMVLGAFVLMGLLIAGAAALGLLGTTLLVPMAAGLVAFITLNLMLLTIATAMLLVKAISKIDIASSSKKVISNMKDMLKVMGSLALMSVAFAVAAVGAAVLLASSLVILAAFTCFVALITAINTIASFDDMSEKVEPVTNAINGVLQIITAISDDISPIALIKSSVNAIILTAAAIPILLAFETILGIAKAIKRIAEIVTDDKIIKDGEFNPDITAAITGCINAISPLLSTIRYVAEGMNKESRKSFQVISECLKPVMEAIMLAPDFVKKLSSPETINTIQNINPEALGETVSLLMMHVQSLLDNIGAEFKSIVGNWFKKKALEGIKPLLDELSNVINAIVGDNGIIKNIQRLTESNKNKEATNEAVQQVTQMVRDMNVLSSKIESLGDTAKAAKKASKNIGKLPDIIEDVVNSINEVSDKFSTLNPQSGTDILSIIDNVLKPFFERLPTVQMDSITQFLNAIEELTRANFKKMVKNFESLNGINFQSAISNIDGLANAVNKLSQSIKSFTENDFVGKLHELNASIKEVNASLSEKATIGMMAPEYSQKYVNSFGSDTLSVSDSENKNSNSYLARMCNILERWDSDGVTQGMTFEQRVKAEKAEANANENAQQKIDAKEKWAAGDYLGSAWSFVKSWF